MIDAEGLSRRFGDVVAVDQVSLRVPDGTLLALLGPNGAGKTTIVRLLTGVLALTAGRATVAGYDVGRDPAAVRARIGLVTDAPGLHEQMTAPSYLDFFGSVYGMSRAARSRRIDELLAFFDLETHRKERMVGFSKGMKQKVALARALLHEPAALATLRAVDGVTAPAEQTRGPAPEATIALVYRTLHPTEVNPEAIARLGAAGARIVSVTCAARSLEDVYAAAVMSRED